MLTSYDGQSITYDTIGNPLSYLGATLTWQGHRDTGDGSVCCDSETGFYYLQSRYYNPEVKRFVNGDGLINQTNIRGYNLFSYCGNNPVNLVDSSGLFFEKAGKFFKNAWKAFKDWCVNFTYDYSTLKEDYIESENPEEKIPVGEKYDSMEEAVLAWSKDYRTLTQKDHMERGAMINSVTVDSKKYYYIDITVEGYNTTCWNAFLLGLILPTGKIEGFIHTHTAYPNENGTWDDRDEGPSPADLFLFYFPSIERQFIANEKGHIYEFDKNKNKFNPQSY